MRLEVVEAWLTSWWFYGSVRNKIWKNEVALYMVTWLYNGRAQWLVMRMMQKVYLFANKLDYYGIDYLKKAVVPHKKTILHDYIEAVIIDSYSYMLDKYAW